MGLNGRRVETVNIAGAHLGHEPRRAQYLLLLLLLLQVVLDLILRVGPHRIDQPSIVDELQPAVELTDRALILARLTQERAGAAELRARLHREPGKPLAFLRAHARVVDEGRAQLQEVLVERPVHVVFPNLEAGEVAKLDALPHLAPESELHVGLTRSLIRVRYRGVHGRRPLCEHLTQRLFLGRLLQEAAHHGAEPDRALHKCHLTPRQVGAAHERLDEAL